MSSEQQEPNPERRKYKLESKLKKTKKNLSHLSKSEFYTFHTLRDVLDQVHEVTQEVKESEFELEDKIQQLDRLSQEILSKYLESHLDKLERLVQLEETNLERFAADAERFYDFVSSMLLGKGSEYENWVRGEAREKLDRLKEQAIKVDLDSKLKQMQAYLQNKDENTVLYKVINEAEELIEKAESLELNVERET